MDVLMVVLRSVHIVLGVVWAGWTFSLAMFVNPAVMQAGPAGGQFMGALAGKTKLVPVMTVAPILIIITGLWMLWIVSGGFNAAYMGSTHGIVISTGSLVGIIAAVYGLGFVRPIAARVGKMGAQIAASGAPPTQEQVAEMGVLRGKLSVGGRNVAVLLLLTVLLMASARYIH